MRAGAGSSEPTGGRVGVTVPFEGLELHEHREPLARLVAAGYSEVSSMEVNALDGLSPLLLASAWEPGLTLSCSVVSAFTRGPAILAMTAAGLAEAAPGRARFGIGAGSDRVVEDFNGIPFARPYTRVAQTLRFLRAVLHDGGRAPEGGFRLARRPSVPPELVVAALGPRMQRLAAAEADGVALNFLSPDDVGRIRAENADVERIVDAPLVVEARVFVVPGSDEAAEMAARRHVAAYLTVPVYTSFQRRLGRGPLLASLLEAWERGDRRAAVAAVPDRLIADLFVTGSARACADGVRRYLDAGVDIATLALLPPHGRDFPAAAQADFLCDLARALGSAVSGR